ncbi:PREDICTED: uncharacterized protein LOC106148067, partial [Chinchilla lanigera]|uniref:uncharacterized protein LOC106148067 n=1 Tax=Chinchilla lanigera TaxID=34839 RepID=UPI000696470A
LAALPVRSGRGRRRAQSPAWSCGPGPASSAACAGARRRGRKPGLDSKFRSSRGLHPSPPEAEKRKATCGIPESEREWGRGRSAWKTRSGFSSGGRKDRRPARWRGRPGRCKSRAGLHGAGRHLAGIGRGGRRDAAKCTRDTQIPGLSLPRETEGCARHSAVETLGLRGGQGAPRASSQRRAQERKKEGRNPPQGSACGIPPQAGGAGSGLGRRAG